MSPARKWALIGSVAVVMCLGCYAAGRYGAPTKVVDRVQVKEVQVEHVRTVTVTLHDAESHRDRDVVTVKKPNGTVIVHEREREHTQTHEQQHTQSDTRQTHTVEVERVRTVERPSPAWHVSVSATRDLTRPLDGPFVFGAQVEHRFIGPLFLGVRADTKTQVGVVIGLSF